MSVFLERYAEEEVEVPLGYRNLLATIIGIQADPTTVEVIFGKYDWIEGGPQIIEIFKACPRHVDLMQQHTERKGLGLTRHWGLKENTKTPIFQNVVYPLCGIRRTDRKLS